MRRTVGFILLGLGVFGVALGLLLLLYAYPGLAKIPLDQQSTSKAEAKGATALAVTDGKAEILRGVNLTATRKVEGNLTVADAKPDGDVAVWQEGVRVTTPEGKVVSATLRQECLDRQTNEAASSCSDRWIEAEQGKREKGFRQDGQNFKFPFFTEQRSYGMFDMSLRRAVEARYDGEDTVKDLDVYRFVQDVAPTKIADQKVPGALVGRSESTVDTERYYSVKRTLWIEPVSGMIVKAEETNRQELRLPGQSTGTVVSDANFLYTDATIDDFVKQASENRSKLRLVASIGPAVLISVGGVLILVGAVLVFLYGRREGGNGRHAPPAPSELVGSR
ncbi:DUF3068 family protein [Herbihabitans rhizosphaerae]|uniref:DUF3068 family protein n=1 Tax=Herbihabitans rhizosphaerae TaxID=1872711 RepID=A0A4Q7L650_9PSEU|nr:DUF3068 domain-containing protein [Herbihabitans rhizosphaerae]RZS44774.1 DUF3068 family protein [Herbihabitans rhizosphaerae]